MGRFPNLFMLPCFLTGTVGIPQFTGLLQRQYVSIQVKYLAQHLAQGKHSINVN